MTEKQASDVLHAIISASHTAHQLRQVKHVSHVADQREKNLLKKNIKLLIESLLPYEQDMEKLDKAQPEAFEDNYNYFYELLDLLSTIRLYESDEIRNIILAYRKDQKSILGITNKILK